MLLDHCKGQKVVLSFAVFHGVLSELHHLLDVPEYHEPGGGVDEAAVARVQRLSQAEESLRTSTSCEEVPFSTTLLKTGSLLRPSEPAMSTPSNPP
jgi:hypothetical protein